MKRDLTLVVATLVMLVVMVLIIVTETSFNTGT